MKHLGTITLSFITALGATFLIWNYVPLDYISVVSKNLGSTITTIQGSDTLSASRSVINTNFSNLNTDKLESGSTATSLTITNASTTRLTAFTEAKFGATATSSFNSAGVLSLASALGVSSGGTGWSNLMANTVLLGNGTSAISTTSALSASLGGSGWSTLLQGYALFGSTTNRFGTSTSLYLQPSNEYIGVGSTTPQRLFSIDGGAAATQECTLTDGATITFNMRSCNQARVTLAGNRTVDFTNENEAMGQTIRFVVCQSTGSNTLTWDSAVRWAGGTAPTLTTTASKCDVIAGFTTMATGTPIIMLDKVLNF